MRLPLATTIQSRDGTLDKDSKLVNLSAEIDGDQSVIVNRPGSLTFFDSYSASAGGSGNTPGQGIFHLNGKVYAVRNDVLTATSTTANGSVSYPITWQNGETEGGSVLNTVKVGGTWYHFEDRTDNGFSSGLVKSTTDGKTYSTVNNSSAFYGNPSSPRALNMAYHGGNFYYFVNDIRQAWTSSNGGVTWALSGVIPLHLIGPGGLQFVSSYCASFNGLLFIYASTGTEFAYSATGLSTNAADWTGGNLASALSAEKFITLNSKLWAFTATGGVKSTSNGTTWVTETTDLGLSSVTDTWTDSGYAYAYQRVAANPGAAIVKRSTDCLTWETVLNVTGITGGTLSTRGQVFGSTGIISHPSFENRYYEFNIDSVTAL